jgi:AraC-like DNA-binding protein
VKAVVEYAGRPASPPLDRFIERIWCCSDAPLHTSERVLPGGGTLDLVINLAEDALRSFDPNIPGLVHTHANAIVAGTRTRSYLIDPRQRASLVGVHFRPGGAFPFLGISPSEIVNAHVELRDLWGAAGQTLREQLLEAGSVSERFRLVEAALLGRLRRARPGHPAASMAVAALRARGGRVRVADVATKAGLSRRRFIEVVETEVGLTPKLYARLQRFHEVKRSIAVLGAPACWATLAVECGYFDQSHMIRDFVEFSGLSPSGYLHGRNRETMFDHLVHRYQR